MRTIIAGSRGLGMIHLLRAMSKCPWEKDITKVISGNARGIDRAGETWATVHEIALEVYPANWREHGRAAGLRRNAQMVALADAAVIVWDGRSRGTLHTLNLATASGLMVHKYVVAGAVGQG